MPASFDFRPLLVATLLFLLLIGVFEAAVRWPALPAARARPAAESITEVDSGRVVEADSTVLVAPPAPAPEPELPPCPAEPIRFEPPGPDEQPQELRRYVGTVGGEPVTVLLWWTAVSNVSHTSGTFYRHRGGPTYTLARREGTGRQTVLEVVTGPEQEGRGEWRLTGRPGAVLRGTWHDSTGRHAVALRENYAGAVRADVHTLRLRGGGGGRPSYSTDQSCRRGSYDYQYLRLPRPGAVAPALRRVIGPPASVRRRVRASYDDAYNNQRAVHILLNDFNLLAYQVWRSSTMVLDEHGDYWEEFYLYDLTTGRELTLLSQLRPDYERPLRQLIQRQLLHDPQFDFINREHENRWNWQDSTGRVTGLVELPEIDQRYNENGHTTQMVLTGSGLEITLAAAGLYDYDELPHDHAHTIEIPYRELRPLVRPGTPLARMLRARGMW